MLDEWRKLLSKRNGYLLFVNTSNSIGETREKYIFMLIQGSFFMSFGRFHNGNREKSQKNPEIVLLHVIIGFEVFIIQCISKSRVDNFQIELRPL